jgi:hypothetical protein
VDGLRLELQLRPQRAARGRDGSQTARKRGDLSVPYGNGNLI